MFRNKDTMRDVYTYIDHQNKRRKKKARMSSRDRTIWNENKVYRFFFVFQTKIHRVVFDRIDLCAT